MDSDREITKCHFCHNKIELAKYKRHIKGKKHLVKKYVFMENMIKEGNTAEHTRQVTYDLENSSFYKYNPYSQLLCKIDI